MLAIFDALAEWFEEPEFKSCMFIKASSEYQDRTHPIHATSAEHKRLLVVDFTERAKKAGVKNPEALARELLVLKEGAIVLAHLHDGAQVAKDARRAAEAVVKAAFDQ